MSIRLLRPVALLGAVVLLLAACSSTSPAADEKTQPTTSGATTATDVPIPSASDLGTTSGDATAEADVSAPDESVPAITLAPEVVADPPSLTVTAGPLGTTSGRDADSEVVDPQEPDSPTAGEDNGGIGTDCLQIVCRPLATVEAHLLKTALR